MFKNYRSEYYCSVISGGVVVVVVVVVVNNKLINIILCNELEVKVTVHLTPA